VKSEVDGVTQYLCTFSYLKKKKRKRKVIVESRIIKAGRDLRWSSILTST